MPKKYTLQINPNIISVKPELLLIQLANSLSFNKLFLLTLEFCGTYSINVSSLGFDNGLSSLTNVAEIQKFLKNYKKLNKRAFGINKLNKVLNYASNNSASPMESRIYIKLCGPANKGYYGCKNLLMNYPIKLGPKSALIAGQSYVKPDFCCPEKKLTIEYDSAQYHENTERGQKDKRRRDALLNDGWTTITLVPAHVYNNQLFDIMARKILRALGQDNRLRIKNFEAKRNASFMELE